MTTAACAPARPARPARPALKIAGHSPPSGGWVPSTPTCGKQARPQQADRVGQEVEPSCKLAAAGQRPRRRSPPLTPPFLAPGGAGPHIWLPRQSSCAPPSVPRCTQIMSTRLDRYQEPNTSANSHSWAAGANRWRAMKERHARRRSGVAGWHARGLLQRGLLGCSTQRPPTLPALLAYRRPWATPG